MALFSSGTASSPSMDDERKRLSPWMAAELGLDFEDEIDRALLQHNVTVAQKVLDNPARFPNARRPYYMRLLTEAAFLLVTP